MMRARRTLWVWGPVWLQMAAIFVASSIPDLTSLPGGVSPYVGHVVGYALLGALLLRAFAGARLQGVGWRSALLAWACAAAYGASDEWHQAFVPGRFATAADWLADLAGAGVAIGVVLTVAVVRRRASGAV